MDGLVLGHAAGGHDVDQPHAAAAPSLIIACGALSHELVAIKRHNALDQLKIQCLPAELHNRPERIAGAVEAMLQKTTGQFAHRFVAYADCGTGGALDRVLERYGVERLAGAHCYEFFASAARFAAMQEDELGTFYLTDFLARHFERLIWQGMGMAKHPELRDMYFAHYRRMVYLVQQPDKAQHALAQQASERLGLPLETLETGLGTMQHDIIHFYKKTASGELAWQS